MTYADDHAHRVAQLWRSQGETFLEDHHDTVVEDVERLRGAVVVREDHIPEAWHERIDATVERLRGWDDAFAERLRALWDEIDARKPGAVVDLTGAEPRVHVPEPSVAISPQCGKCGSHVAADRLVRPFGDHEPPFCIPCARQIAGFRPRRTR